MSKEKCISCNGKGQVLNIGNYYTMCRECNGTGVDSVKKLKETLRFNEEIYWKAIDKILKLEELIKELKKQNEDANLFIKTIAELLKIDIDGVGYDGIQLTIEDFESKIKQLEQQNEEMKRCINNAIDIMRDHGVEFIDGIELLEVLDE